MQVKLDIISDPVCPWCYVGKSLLDRALAQRPGHPFVIEWHPFELSPDIPREGMDRVAFLEMKFGPGGGNSHSGAVDLATSQGIEMNYDQVTRRPHTLDAHRLIHWAGIEKCQSEVVDGIFNAYWREGRDIGKREVLADIADAAGMDAALVMRLFESPADEEDIRKREAHSNEMGVTSVPTFVVAQKHAVPGAQPIDLWLQVIDEIMQQIASDEAAEEVAQGESTETKGPDAS
ncbi:DsbA family oxidoreductase [Pseudooceanicola algae]|uniref:DSBA-like thioredoxin domain-containing protein n=1 Tax=Pseudooceanicola algae TaxID=1537215 RepID=A0A418SDY0_9RHOB|nr:DsbA family oxidoreductase [Pseudooceanicola algae]QPM89565.1 hypothetical protein PSAL_007860 [Pseudooceanicola algae]